MDPITKLFKEAKCQNVLEKLEPGHNVYEENGAGCCRQSKDTAPDPEHDAQPRGTDHIGGV